MFFSQCTEAMSQFLREFWSLDVSCPGPSRLRRSAGPMRSELRCLAAGQPSRPISVEAPLWSQVVGSAYREDQQRSVSLLPHSRPISLSFCPTPLHLLSTFFFLPSSPFGITSLPSPPSSCFFLLKSPYFHLYLIIVILPALPPLHSLSLSLLPSSVLFVFRIQPAQNTGLLFWVENIRRPTKRLSRWLLRDNLKKANL